jgi:DNA-binding Xre family transcriptional regulator
MDKESVLQAVKQVIETAMAKKGWSRRKLAVTVGIDEHTMKRWYTGENDSFQLKALIDLFETAGLSMDQLFGLEGSQPLPAITEAPRTAELEEEVRRYKWMLDQLRSGGTIPASATPEPAIRPQDMESHARDAATEGLDRAADRLTQDDKDQERRKIG